MNNQKINRLLPSTIFSVLGFLAWLLLANYAETDVRITETLGSLWAGVFMVVLFNILGIFIVRISSWLNMQYMQNAGKRWKVALAYALVMVTLLLINYGFLVTAKLLTHFPHPFTFPNGGMRILMVVWFVEMVVLGLLLVNRAATEMFRYRERMLLMREENIAARYSALQEQLNPHFLFNSFNTLVAEIEYNPKRAAIFTRRLSDVYRYVLQAQRQKIVTLGEELRFASAFLYLHEVRLGDCIRCDVRVEEEQLEFRLPPLSLQLLLENVIKHNSISASFPMLITITVEDEQLIVSNVLHPRTCVESAGVGLTNLSNRCRMIVGRDIRVVREQDSFTVKIPLLYE